LLRTRARGMRHPLDIDQLQELAVVFGRIIDFRSPFTATHSTGVATSASSIAGLMGIGSDEIKLINIAGHLHDLGKLAVPPSILDKPGPLAPDEASVMRSHAYHTYRILEMVPGMETINAWAAFHHERVGGGGYPFMPATLPLQARIIAVADVFTALSEDRPYRFGMSRPEVVAILRREVAQGALDGDVVATVLDNFDVLDQLRHVAQHAPSRNGTLADRCWQDEAWGQDRFSRKEGVA
jgi:HD-GYP domain-containing protein (c-di-GMP phosphodiesterase class II)